MRTKRVVHTGPKIQFGGAMSGRVMVLYHPFTDEVVNTEPMSPATWGTMRDMTSLILLFIATL